MKKLILLIVALAAALSLTAYAGAVYDPTVNYMEVMLAAAASGDTVTGMEAAAARNEKLEDMALGYGSVDFGELYLLAKIIYAEAGSSWLSDEWKMCVGEVVLNRVASPEFPNTIEEVIYQRGQYYSRGSRYFASLKPSERCVGIAFRLLRGERYINDPRVVFQANFRQGSGVAIHFRDRYLGSTYFCYSSHPELYGNEIEVSAETLGSSGAVNRTAAWAVAYPEASVTAELSGTIYPEQVLESAGVSEEEPVCAEAMPAEELTEVPPVDDADIIVTLMPVEMHEITDIQ